MIRQLNKATIRGILAASALAGAIVAAPALATGEAPERISIQLSLKPDMDHGRQVFHTCARCHLPEAWGDHDGNYPQLAGQHASVLVKQLLAIREGRRDSPLMYPFVQDRTIGGYQSIADVVAYIATLPMTPNHATGPWPPGTGEFQRGRELYNQNCAQCHGKTGLGDTAHAYPRLQGQHYRYMLRQVARAKAGLRTVDPGMRAIIMGLGRIELREALNYVSFIPVAPGDVAPSESWRNPDFTP